MTSYRLRIDLKKPYFKALTALETPTESVSYHARLAVHEYIARKREKDISHRVKSLAESQQGRALLVMIEDLLRHHDLGTGCSRGE
jgi:hypothetical protein